MTAASPSRQCSPGILILDVLDGAAALNAANGKTGGIREAADHPSLPLEGALYGLVQFRGLLEVDDVDIPVCRANHQQVVLHVHRVHALLDLHRRGGLLLPEVPVFHRLVPRSRRHHRRAVGFEVPYASYGLFVLCYLEGLAGGEIGHSGLLVGAARDQLLSVLWASSVQLSGWEQGRSVLRALRISR